jgi:hypothetical protein
LPDTKQPAGLDFVIQLLPRLAAPTNMVGYFGGNYAAFRGMEITPEALCRQVGIGMVPLYLPGHLYVYLSHKQLRPIGRLLN